jgi:diaminopimelate decarboxylase
MRIFISGLYSGTNPQPGVGIARSLRAAYPTATLFGVEYSNRCSGIHWQDFDHIWLQPPWEHIDFNIYADRIKQFLDEGGLWISGIDLEIMWLSSVFPNGHPNLLIPPTTALRNISKPAVEAHRGLPVKIPEFISTEQSDWDLHSFCREHGWKVWLKGPYYEAVRTSSWDTFERVRAILSEAWSTDRLFLQAHVTGYEESVCFCAYNGQLVDAVYMRKRELTEEGKTWAGEVTDVPERFAGPLRQMIAELNWTGGAELEMVRDPGDGLWLLECNPRFPAWIHGSSITGRNLPAAMVEHVSKIKAKKSRSTSGEFTRVVLEIPVREDFPLPSLAEPYPGGIGHSLKHPSGTLALAERLQKLHVIEGKANNNGDSFADANNNGNGSLKTHTNSKRNGDGDGRRANVLQFPHVPSTFITDLSNLDLESTETPSWLFFQKTAAATFEQAARLTSKFSRAGVKVRNGYSIKTNPDVRLMCLARDYGFLAEAISLAELQKAIEVGFKPEHVVLNGPGKWWPNISLPRSPLHAVFSDSLADFTRVVERLESDELQAKVVGARLRPPGTGSRFGISVDTPEALGQLVDVVKSLPRTYLFGVHFHMASSNIGIRQWWHVYESILRWCRSIEQLSQRSIACLDIGGGWFPDDWHHKSPDRLEGAITRALATLPNLEEIISEPGKAIAQPTMAVAMRLLEVHESRKEIEGAVVDGSIAELPMQFVQPHRILYRNQQGNWEALRRGKTRLLGRLCMENDVVAANVELPPHIRAGDLLVFCDAGAYDRSMSYDFGRG